MKKWMLSIMAVCLLLTGCGQTEQGAEEDTAAPGNAVVETEESTPDNAEQSAVVVQPLPDTTMDDLNDAILAVSLEEGGAYVDDEGILQMDVFVYSYNKYDMVDIATLAVGDTLSGTAGDMVVTSMEQTDTGLIIINGGLTEGGIELTTNDEGIYYEIGFDDVKSWYEVGEATLRVSTEFEYVDKSDLEKGDVVYYPGSFLTEEVTDYNFTPYNTTIRVEGGQIVEMTRIFTP